MTLGINNTFILTLHVYGTPIYKELNSISYCHFLSHAFNPKNLTLEIIRLWPIHLKSLELDVLKPFNIDCS